MNDAITAWIRTTVPVAVGTALTTLSTWLFDHHVLWVKIDTAAAQTWATAIVVVAYYTAVKWLESRWPKAGVLLGNPKKPTYTAA